MWRERVAIDRNSGILIYEWLLRSKFRTTDPNKATIFWLPVAPMGQVTHGVPLLAIDWVRKTYPYYNRSNGADHAVVFPWDSVRAPALLNRGLLIKVSCAALRDCSCAAGVLQ